MSIALVITDGYGNGTIIGSPSDVILHGFSIGNIWTEITDTTTVWVGQSDASTTWTEITDATTVWAEETDTSTTWTEIPDTTTTWT